MSKKKIFKMIGIFISIALIYGIYKIATFQIFDDEIKMIEQIKVPNRNYSIKIYYIPSNASSQSYIQIRKLENGVVEVLKNYERYNHLDKYKLIGSDTLEVAISDTSRTNTSKEFKIKLP